MKLVDQVGSNKVAWNDTPVRIWVAVWVMDLTLLGGAFKISAAFGLPNFCSIVSSSLYLLCCYAASTLWVLKTRSCGLWHISLEKLSCSMLRVTWKGWIFLLTRESQGCIRWAFLLFCFFCEELMCWLGLRGTCVKEAWNFLNYCWKIWFFGLCTFYRQLQDVDIEMYRRN